MNKETTVVPGSPLSPGGPWRGRHTHSYPWSLYTVTQSPQRTAGEGGAGQWTHPYLDPDLPFPGAAPQSLPPLGSWGSGLALRHREKHVQVIPYSLRKGCYPSQPLPAVPLSGLWWLSSDSMVAEPRNNTLLIIYDKYIEGEGERKKSNLLLTFWYSVGEEILRRYGWNI